ELLVGGRSEAGVVKEGCERAELSAEFDLQKRPQVESWVDANELNGDPGQAILRRTIDRSGRTRCFINGHSATLAQLKELGELLGDIHGQPAHQALLRAAAQRDLLDAHAEAGTLARDTAEAFRDWKRLERVAEEAQKSFAAREAERAETADTAAELRKLALREGEWELVSAEHARLAHGSSLLAGAQSALEAVTQAEGAARAQLSAVATRLRALSGHDGGLDSIG